MSDETKREAKERLVLGLAAVARLCSFSPYISGPAFTAADCVAYVHFLMIRLTTQKIYGENLLDAHFPEMSDYVRLMDTRQHVRQTMLEREGALAAFAALNVDYEG